MSRPGDSETAEAKHVLRLYVTGSTQRSTRAITNLRRVLETL